MLLAGIRWSTGIEDAWSKVATVVPKIGVFLLILVLGRIVAGFAARLVRRIAVKAGLERWFERFGVARYVRQMGFSVPELVGRIARIFVMFLALTTAFAVFGADNPVSRVINRLIDYTPKAIVAVVIVVVTAMLANGITGALRRVRATAQANEGIVVPEWAFKAIPIGLWTIGIFAAIDELEIAQDTVHTLFQALVYALVGIAVVAIGGGGIQPMRSRWERWLGKAERALVLDDDGSARVVDSVDHSTV